MRVILLLIALCATTLTAAAQGRGGHAALQAALALEGHYAGPIDGAWGPASERAARGLDRQGLLGALAHEWSAAGWRPLRGPDGGPGVLAPMGLLRQGRAAEGVEYVSPGGDLSLGFVRRDGTGTMALHSWLERSSPGGVIQTDELGRLITRGRLGDGTRIYMWSHFRSELDARTVVIRWRGGEARRARLLTASVVTGEPVTPTVPPPGPIVNEGPLGPEVSLRPPERPYEAPVLVALPDTPDGTPEQAAAEMPEVEDPTPVELAAAPERPQPAPDPFESADPALAAIRPEPRETAAAAPIIGGVVPQDETDLAETPSDEVPDGAEPAVAEAAPDEEAPAEDDPIEVAAAPSDLPEDDGPPMSAPGEAMPLPEPGTVIGTGTGFYVGPDKVVTNAHVIAPCNGIVTASGAPMELRAVDSGRDLALLYTPVEAAAWMPLGPEESPLLGSPVRVLGFPFGGAYHDGVSVTSGLVSARGASWVGPERLMISAPIQPGNSGGPVLATSGEVIGVVTSRLNSADGTPLSELPQNMAYAVPTAALRDFLREAEAEPEATEPRAIDAGIPRDAEAAVVHLLCLS